MVFLNKSVSLINKEPFFCSLCAKTKSRITERVKCSECARFICIGCFESLSMVGLVQCPYCSSPLSDEGSELGTPETIEIIQKASRMAKTGDYFSAEAYFQQALKIDSNSMVARKKLGQLYFQMKNWEKSFVFQRFSR
ncbi:MAG: hypothetical protein JSW11_21080 [Candidatus Heimdallarchaeota archaeon]|nr:MAG: hypothetical protein JSW11_21080 [Candidatus Heimdallarchaeota archaeon]